MTVAVLLTTFNRRQKTLTCLESLRKQQLPPGVELSIYITDDASSDGTAEAVSFFYPEVKIFPGTGSLFWAGGMRRSWTEALKDKPEHYLLLNDDTLLHPHAVSTLLQYSSQVKADAPDGICIGSTVDQETGKISYGGRRLRSKFRWSSKMIYSDDEYLPCDFGNANIMLVASGVVNRIGILSGDFTHGLADYDYTLKAKKTGFNVCIAPGFLGTCQDDHGNNWKSGNVTLTERIQYLKSPKGLAYREYLAFMRNHFPVSYPTAFLKLWMKTLFPFIWDAFKKQ